MHRTQLLLEDWQYEKLLEASRRSGRAMGDLVREAVTRYVVEPAAARDAVLDVIGIGHGSGPPVAREHDRVLYQPAAGAAGKEAASGTRVRRHQRVVRGRRSK